MEGVGITVDLGRRLPPNQKKLRAGWGAVQDSKRGHRRNFGDRSPLWCRTYSVYRRDAAPLLRARKKLTKEKNYPTDGRILTFYVLGTFTTRAGPSVLCPLRELHRLVVHPGLCTISQARKRGWYVGCTLLSQRERGDIAR